MKDCDGYEIVRDRGRDFLWLVFDKDRIGLGKDAVVAKLTRQQATALLEELRASLGSEIPMRGAWYYSWL
jgi:hypothetical protein